MGNCCRWQMVDFYSSHQQEEFCGSPSGAVCMRLRVWVCECVFHLCRESFKVSSRIRQDSTGFFEMGPARRNLDEAILWMDVIWNNCSYLSTFADILGEMRVNSIGFAHIFVEIPWNSLRYLGILKDSSGFWPIHFGILMDSRQLFGSSVSFSQPSIL